MFEEGGLLNNSGEQPLQKNITTVDIWKARKLIKPYIQRTPLIFSKNLSEQTDAFVYLKLENLQQIGSFKVRGAANKILSLTAEQRKKGVVTFSSGNHGIAVAYIAKKLGIKAVVCISRHVPKVKVDAITNLGAKVEICGESQDEAEEHCYYLEKVHGLTTIKPFDDPDIIAGQGTIGLEILEEIPDVG